MTIDRFILFFTTFCTTWQAPDEFESVLQASDRVSPSNDPA